MRFVVDHDMHMHSKLSLCSLDPGQTTDALLDYAKKNDLKTLILTDHYWDESVPKEPFGFYDEQDYAHIAAALPLPQAEGIRFLFGCETDMDKYFHVGVAPEHYDLFDFIVIPTTHLHMDGFTIDEKDDNLDARARLWVERFDALLNMDLPFHKIGVAHLTCSLMAPRQKHDHIDVLNRISDETLHRLFTRSAELGMGIELNFPLLDYQGQDLQDILRIYRIAKECGNKFYFASDTHHPEYHQNIVSVFEKIVDILELQESDKFVLA